MRAWRMPPSFSASSSAFFSTYAQNVSSYSSGVVATYDGYVNQGATNP